MRFNELKAGAVVGMVVLAAACSKSSSPTGPSGPSRTLTSVTIGGSSSSVSEGGTTQLTATAQYSDSTTDTVTGQATWTSSNPAVATVSATGLLTGVKTGTVDVTATFQNTTGRRTVQVAPARFQLRVQLNSVTAIDTCDDFTQGLTSGEFAVQVRTVLASGSSDTIVETRDYPGNPASLSALSLARGGSRSLGNTETYTVNGASGQFLRVEFRATEWDEQIVIIPPSTRWVRDDSMDNRLGTRTSSYNGSTFSNLGPSSITLGSGGCQIRLDYEVTATRQ
ncbi:MAG: Ig-like domain-containing protein [Vicinamibacterales bacterium]